MGGATEYRTFPGDIVEHLGPAYVMGIHWEDFFDPRRCPLPGETRARRASSTRPGSRRASSSAAVRDAQPPGGRAIVPCPDKVATFRKGASGWELTGDDEGWTKPKR